MTANIELLRLDTEVYSLDAIQRAVFDFLPVVSLHLRKEEQCICIETDTCQDISVFSKKEFLATVLDHQLRIRLETTTAPIRTLIIGRALYPEEKIENVLTSMLTGSFQEQ